MIDYNLICKKILISLVLFYMWTSCAKFVAQSFNVDIHFPTFFSGNQNSYFGFSVALHKNKEGPLALISATRSNSSILEELIEPGALHKCRLNDSFCQEIVLDTQGNVFTHRGNEYSYRDKKDNMWLGVSLDVQPEGQNNIVICGHLWKNQHYKQHYLANGVCYVINSDLAQSSVKKLVPFVQKSKQSIIPPGIYYYAFGQVGCSATFSSDGEDLFLGAPGFYDWIGTVVTYKMGSYGQPSDIRRQIVPDPPADQSPSPEAYIGYSITSGRFFESGQMFVAVGAPRDGGNKGRVYIFEALTDLNPKIKVHHKKEGIMLGEYFGAAVLGVDLNNDEFTDLLVSSPMFSEPRKGNDEGKVYVFVSTHVSLELSAVLIGQKPQGRFGTTLASLGDINQDGFNDVAVGAPYEEERGAVYIYHGTDTGISSTFSQRISAIDVDPSLSGFGISISRGTDIDFNHYPDILVGSYLSDQAVLFRSSPVVQVHSRLAFDPVQINQNVSDCQYNGKSIPCVNVSCCLRYTGKYVPENMEFSLTLEVDSSRQRDLRSPRGHFYINNKPSIVIREKVSLSLDVESCFVFETYITAEKQDIISPIDFTMTHNLAGRISRLFDFCKTCAILDVNFPTSISKSVTFQTGCGEDNDCLSDLILYAAVIGMRHNHSLIIGLNTSFTIEVQVTNLGEPAYLSEVFITLPSEVVVINQAQCDIVQNSRNTDTSVSLVCGIGNPLYINQTNQFFIRLDTSKLPNDAEEIKIYLKATTVSQETTPSDNEMTVTVNFEALADISVMGFADKDQIQYGDSSKLDIIPFIHTYIVVKDLHTSITAVDIFLSVPTTLLGSSMDFIQFNSIEVDTGKSSSVPGSCNVTLINLRPEVVDYGNYKEQDIDVNELIAKNETTGVQKVKRNVNNKNDATHTDDHLHQKTVLNCTYAECKIIQCMAGPFLNNRKMAIVRISAAVNISLLNSVLEKWDIVDITSKATVVIRDKRRNIQPQDHRPDSAIVTTTLLKLGPSPAKQVDNWIIFVSIGVGLFLLILILLGLIRIGFFKRKQKDAMNRMMQQASLEEWEPYLVTDDDDDKVPATM